MNRLVFIMVFLLFECEHLNNVIYLIIKYNIILVYKYSSLKIYITIYFYFYTLRGKHTIRKFGTSG